MLTSESQSFNAVVDVLLVLLLWKPLTVASSGRQQWGGQVKLDQHRPGRTQYMTVPTQQLSGAPVPKIVQRAWP